MLQCHHARGATGHDDVRRERDQFRSVFALAIDFIFAPADVDRYITAVTPAQLLQPLHECLKSSLTVWIVFGSIHQPTAPPYLLELLRTRGERPRRHYSTDETNELASPHSRP